MKSNYKPIGNFIRLVDVRNKELKNLYLQNDYVVKPEYLEWNIFFSTFYSNKNNKGQNNKSLYG